MGSYSEQFKDEAVKKYLTRGSRSVDDIAREMGTTSFSIYHWSKQRRHLQSLNMKKLKNVKSSGIILLKKMEALVDYSRLPEASRGEYLRKAGLTEAKIEAWRTAFESGSDKGSSEIKAAQQQVKQLERELLRKDRALAETAALLVLQKKTVALMNSLDEL